MKLGFEWLIGDGLHIWFWHDVSWGSCPLKVTFSKISETCNQQDILVSEVMRLAFGSLTFRRAFGESEIEEWNTLREVVDNLELNPNPDIMRRGLTTTESFTTQYLYKAITLRGVRGLKMQEVWQSPSLMKMKHFLWQAMRDGIQSAEQFKKKGEGSEKCLLCGTLESTNHILFMCPMASFIWCIWVECNTSRFQ